MMRRCILEFASSQSTKRIPRQITSQIPSLVSARKELSVEPQQNAPKGSGSAGKPSESGTNFSKLVIGSVAIGAVVMAAYQTGYLNKLYTKEVPTSHESAKTDTGNKVFEDDKKLEERGVLSNNQDLNKLNSVLEHSEEKNEALSGITEIQDRSNSRGEDKVEVQDGQEVRTSENSIPIRENLLSSPQSIMTSDDQHTNTESPSKGSPDVKDLETKSSMERGTGVDETPISSESMVFPEETKMNSVPSHHHTAEDVAEDAVGNGVEPPSSSLLDAYNLREKADRSTEASVEDKDGCKHFSEEVLAGNVEKLNDASMIKDGKLVLDFLQAIHTAEKRQADLDAQGFAEEKRILKEKYEKELKDARARELMYAEEAAILEKELNKERVKAAAAIRSLQGKAEENLKLELERKEKEAELQLKKVQDLAKAEHAAAIASEKASQIEKMAEANLHINALCMAFYARSEEARQSHSVHKLALGALALEDALSKGLPIQTEINALHTYLEGIDRDSFLDLVLSSLPEDTLYYGTDTQLQLNQRFNALKGTLRHYSLIPPGGGGILAHTLAHIASSIKVQEDDQSGDGIESLISRVESFLAEGKLAEAADALEGGLRGSQAEEVAGDWVRRVRNRAITEQALTLLQSYATSISIT